MSTKRSRNQAIDIGISAGHREKIVKELSTLLADSYTLLLPTSATLARERIPFGVRKLT